MEAVVSPNVRVTSLKTINAPLSPSSGRLAFLRENWSDPTAAELVKLKAAFARAQLRLGEKMFELGIDDGELGSQIARLDHQLRCDGDDSTTSLLRKNREKLLRQLADAALGNDAPLPGAQLEFHCAWTARAAIHRLRASLARQFSSDGLNSAPVVCH